MIEHIRKYNFIIVLSILLVVIALVIGLRSDVSQGLGGGRAYIKVGNRTYSDVEYRKLGPASLELISTIARSGDFAMYQFVYSMSPKAIMFDTSGNADEEFFINRMIIRQAKQEFGIHPSTQQVDDYILKMRAFSGPDQKFNPEAYNRFKENALGQYGMSEKDFRELISDVMASDQIRSLVGGGLMTNRDAVRLLSNLSSQKIDGSLARLDVDDFRKNIQTTNDELKAYWELIQDAFKTEPQRRFTYVLVGADLPAETATEEETKPSIADAVMSPEDKAKADQEKADAKAKKDAELAELRRQKQRELDIRVDDFANAILDEKGNNFESLAAEYQWTIQSTPLFSQSSPPTEIDLPLRLTSSEGRAVTELFRISPTADPVSKFSDPIAVGESHWLIARLDEEIPARNKTFEEATEQVRSQYIAEKAREEMKTATEAAHSTIKEALASGQAFSAAAASAGLIDVRSFSQIDAKHQASPLTEPQNFFRAASTVDPGTVAEPIIEPTQAFILFVEKREITRDPTVEEQVKSQLDVLTNQNEMAAFGDWLTSRNEAADVKRLYRQ